MKTLAYLCRNLDSAALELMGSKAKEIVMPCSLTLDGSSSPIPKDRQKHFHR